MDEPHKIAMQITLRVDDSLPSVTRATSGHIYVDRCTYQTDDLHISSMYEDRSTCQIDDIHEHSMYLDMSDRCLPNVLHEQ